MWVGVAKVLVMLSPISLDCDCYNLYRYMFQTDKCDDQCDCDDQFDCDDQCDNQFECDEKAEDDELCSTSQLHRYYNS